jgi:uncharacterized protein YcfJ
MRIWTGWAVFGLGCVIGGAALAQDPGSYALADVVSVDPIIENVREPVTHQVCWQQPVTYRETVVYPAADSERRSSAGPILGAVIGGLIGNELGRGHRHHDRYGDGHGYGYGYGYGDGHGDHLGRNLATVAGAAIGYSIGRDRQRDRQARYPSRYAERVYQRNERRCRVATDYREDQRVVAYDVAYRYQGHTYHTETDAHPGSTLRVAVQVVPVR